MHRRRHNARRHRLVACPMIVLSAVSVSCATPYKMRGTGGDGYSSFRIADNLFSVSFKGNAATPEDLAEMYLFRRASEVTLEHGFKYFVIEAEKGRSRSSSLGYSALKIPLVAPGASIRIRCYHEPPAEDASLVDAENFLRFNFPEAVEEVSRPGEESTPQ